jgi:predicted Rossmann-fold nucleotide-binding protein
MAATLSLRRLCVFTGSHEGNNPIYAQSAEELASEMLRRQIDLVYGGGTIGLMGKVAKTIQQGYISPSSLIRSNFYLLSQFTSYQEEVKFWV